MRSVFSPPRASCPTAVSPTSPTSAASSATISPSDFSISAPTGTFVGYKVDDYLIIASDKVRSGEGKLPASTFKIPNSLIALETGVVEDPDKDVFKWDGVTRSIEAWNKDHTLRSAIAVSAVPVYQEIARRIGAERMQKYVDLFDYGNRNIGGGIDQFWLTGDLRIDPDPAGRFRRPAAPRRAAGVEAQPGSGARHPAGHQSRRRHHPRQDRVCSAPSRASRRWAGWSAGPRRATRSTVFALNMDCKEPSHIAARMTVVQQCLADIVAI